MKGLPTYRWCKSLLVAAVLACCGLTGMAQDIHFSQFYFSPLNLNPAATGIFDGDYRIAGNHRQQWRSVTTPYTTFGI